MADKLYTPEDTLKLVREAAERGETFKVKIARRKDAMYAPQTVCTFEGVTLQQIDSVEEWVPLLFGGGGGTYELSIYSTGQPGVPMLGGIYKVSLEGPVRPFDATPMKDASWPGPTPEKMKFPIVNGVNFTYTGTATNTAQPSAPASSLPTNAVGTAPQREAQNIANSTSVPHEKVEANRLSLVAAELDRREKELEAERRRLDIDALRREFSSQKAVAPPAQDNSLIIEMIRQSNEDRRAHAQQMSSVLERIAQRPGVDPMLEKLLEKALNKGEESKQFVEMLGAMSTTVMQVLAANVEMQAAMQPQEESPAYKLARQGMTVLAGIMGGPKVAQASVAAVGGDASFGGAEMPALPAGKKVKLTKTQALVRIIQRKAPFEEVVKRFVKALRDPEFLSIVERHKGNWQEVSVELLGEWAMEDTSNMAYVQNMLPKVLEWGTAQGLLSQPTAPAAPAKKRVPKNGHAKPAPAPEPVKEAPPAEIETETPSAEA